MFSEKLRKKVLSKEQEKHFLNVFVPSTIGIFNISNDIDNGKLVKDIHTFKERYPNSMHVYNKEHTYVNAWHSDYQTQKMTDILDILIKVKQEKIAKNFNLNITRFELDSIWINMYSIGNNADRHMHGLYGYSASYYPYVEDNATPIVFDNNYEKDFEQFSIIPKTGMLIVFPSYMYHRVNTVKEPSRISISSNWWLGKDMSIRDPYKFQNYENH